MLRHPDPPISDGMLTLRQKRPADADAIVHACQDPEIPRWTRVPSPYTPEQAREWLAASEAELTRGGAIDWLVVDAEDRLLGSVGLMNIDRERDCVEIGYWVAAAARGAGVAARAVALVRDWAHAELGLGTVEILVNAENLASRAVARRAGFAETGELREAPRDGGPPGDYVVHLWSAS